MVQFNLRYLLATIFLFATEVLIALYVHDNFFRPVFGDFLVVILIYCFIRSFLKANPVKIGIAVLAFAVGVEVLQYFQLVKLLGLENNTVARIVIGSSFSWTDILAYFCGTVFIVMSDKYEKLNKT